MRQDLRILLSVADRRTTARVVIGLVLAVVAQVLLVVWTLILATAAAKALTGERVTGDLVVLGALVPVRAFMRALSTASLTTASTELRAAHRRRLAALVTGAADPTHPDATTGDLAGLLGPGIDDLEPFVTRYLPARAAAMTVPLLVAVLVGVRDLLSLAILLFTGPMLVTLLAIVGARTRSLTERRFRELAWLRSFHLDMVQGIPTLHVFGRARGGSRTIGEISERFGRTTMDVLRTAFQTSLVIEWAATAATALVAVQVGLRLVDGDLAFSLALAVLVLTPEFFAPVRTLAVEYHAGQAGGAVLARLREFGDAGRDGTTPTTASPTVADEPRRAPALRLDGVSLRSEGGSLLLADADLAIAAGETIALIGGSGVGKTSLLRTLRDARHPDGGRILVDGVPLDSLERAQWRAAVTFVAQRPAMLSGTIAEAVTLSDPGASDERLDTALRIACIDEFVDALPDGAHTPIGEGGLRLSGGQRQRLAIARCVLRDAPFVVLDEFTAHLDPETEAEVVRRITPFLAHRTVLLATHREATLALADRVVELVDGRLVGAGR